MKSPDRGIFLHRPFYTDKFWHKDIFTQRNFYAQTRLHTIFFTQKLLHTEAFTHKSSCSQDFFPVQWGVFTHKSVYTKKFVHILNFVMLQNRESPLFLPFDPHFVRNSRIRDFQIAILPQFSPFGLHFVWKGCICSFKIGCFHQFLRFDPHSRATPSPIKFEFRHTFVRPARAISA